MLKSKIGEIHPVVNKQFLEEEWEKLDTQDASALADHLLSMYSFDMTETKEMCVKYEQYRKKRSKRMSRRSMTRSMDDPRLRRAKLDIPNLEQILLELSVYTETEDEKQ